MNYKKSTELFAKVKKIIPLASQTFSKSYLQYITGDITRFIERGRGSHVWDVDGNELIDMTSGLLPVVLGYAYPIVNEAIKAQLEKGITFSLPTPLEHDLAEKLVSLIPGAEMVRYGKNGSDATAAAVRLARHITGRDHVAVCGYHGWQDWYIGVSNKPGGVPQAVINMVHVFDYNQPETLAALFKQFPGQVAAVIMEPMNSTDPVNNFLSVVKDIAHDNGALFIFDEVITGFRYDLRGAQTLLGVTPDLSTFGKSMANGMPISALVGKAKYMERMEEIFISSTFGGECLSLAASLATIKEIEEKNVIAALWDSGEKTKNGLELIIAEANANDIVKLKGKPCWQQVVFEGNNGISDLEFKSIMQQTMFDHGILWYGQHNWNYSHSDEDIKRLLSAYTEGFKLINRARNEGHVKNVLRSGPIVGSGVRKL